MATKQQKIKGNPASKRMSNAHLAIRRERSWARGQKKKERNRADNKARQVANDNLRAQGQLTPWEKAVFERYAKRHENCTDGSPCRINKEYSHADTR